MASNQEQLWSSIAKDKNYTGGTRTFSTEQNPTLTQRQQKNQQSSQPTSKQNRNTKNTTQTPKTAHPSDPVYVLTLLTNPTHQTRMTSLRNQYFPPKLNKLGAHLTLFHALPAHKLQSTIIPTLQRVAAETQPFKLHAAKPFRLKKGIAISVPSHQGGEQAREVHEALLGGLMEEGEGEWLSEQDRGGVRVHYTIMNKVDDEGEVERALEEVRREWKGDWGEVTGLGLWRYERGWWKWTEGFWFAGVEGQEEEGGGRE